jgi:hypothetical protein
MYGLWIKVIDVRESLRPLFLFNCFEIILRTSQTEESGTSLDKLASTATIFRFSCSYCFPYDSVAFRREKLCLITITENSEFGTKISFRSGSRYCVDSIHLVHLIFAVSIRHLVSHLVVG